MPSYSLGYLYPFAKGKAANLLLKNAGEEAFLWHYLYHLEYQL